MSSSKVKKLQLQPNVPEVTDAGCDSVVFYRAGIFHGALQKGGLTCLRPWNKARSLSASNGVCQGRRVLPL